MEPPPARNFQSCIRNCGLDPWVENPRNEDGSSWAHHEGVEGAKGVHVLLLMLPSFLSLPSFNLSSNPSRLLLLGFLLALEWVERENVANGRMSERVWLQLRNIYPISCWHVDPTFISGKQLISHFLLLIWYLSDTPVNLADCLVACCLCWIDSTIKWVSNADRVIVSWCDLWGWVGVDDVNRISPNPLGVSLLALGVSLTMAI